MPGVVFKKKSGGEMRPDWTLIGYSDCPQTTLDGHAYALDIHDNWDPTLTSAYQMFYQDYKLMYFPKNIDTSNLTNMQQMFKESNIEDLYIDASGVTGAGLNEICKGAVNLRSVDIEGVKGYSDPDVITSMNNSFQDCYSLEYIDISKRPGRRPGVWYMEDSLTSLDHMCSGCRSLKEMSIVMENSDNTLTNLDHVFRDCWNMEYTEVKAGGVNRFGAYYMGSQTANGTLCDIDIGSVNNDVRADFQNSKIAAGSKIGIYRLSNNQNEMFKNATIHFDNTSYFWIEAAMNTYQNCTNMFQNAYFPDGFSGFSVMSIRDIGNAQNMFRSTHFTGANKTADLSGFTWYNCQNFQSMFEASDVVTITGNLDLSSATNVSYMFSNCSTLDNDTVNRILGWLVNATGVVTKTLASMGFTSANYPAATIQSLSNYSAFTAAGWIIGY